jgi:hypothetical protein
MGVQVVNTQLLRDHATPQKDSVIRLHMDLPVGEEQFIEMNELLNANEWEKFEARLVEKHPQHRDILEIWLSKSRDRSMEREKTDTALKVVNG